MMPSLEQQKKYWDETWDKRCSANDPSIVMMNKSKLNFLCTLLGRKPYYLDLDKLDVGCGTCIHHSYLSEIHPNWQDTVTGIDLSRTAIEKAKHFGFNAENISFYDYSPGRQFDAFFFLDSLEHFDDLKKVRQKVDELGRGDYYIFGNIPLYSHSTHATDGGFEQPLERQDLVDFFGPLGFTSFWQRIYGSFGFPYMVFEGRKNKPLPLEREHEDIIALSTVE